MNCFNFINDNAFYCISVRNVSVNPTESAIALSNWASEASPTLGCSIEISGDIYVGMSVVCQINCVGGITWTKHAHAQSQVFGC